MTLPQPGPSTHRPSGIGRGAALLQFVLSEPSPLPHGYDAQRRAAWQRYSDPQQAQLQTTDSPNYEQFNLTPHLQLIGNQETGDEDIHTEESDNEDNWEQYSLISSTDSRSASPLPLPGERILHFSANVIHLNGSTPTRFQSWNQSCWTHL